MPFASVSRPAIGISILKARLREEGIDCACGYPNLLFADYIGLDVYELICSEISPAMFLGDWLFAQHLFGDKLNLDAYLATLQNNVPKPSNFDTILEVQGRIAAYIEACLTEYKIADYDIIGFSTTFEQNMPSLALAKRIKDMAPEKTIVFGGANVESVMGLELHRQFEWIDYICSGEAEVTFPELVRRLEQGQNAEGLRGVVYRNDGQSTFHGSTGMIQDMDSIPDPDYDDYFDEVARHPVGIRLNPVLLIESSRGCWWGAKAHCTFCGLNGSTMAFRKKSPERVLQELEKQRDRYHLRKFLAVDNILPTDYFKTLFPMLKERQLGISLFYEIKSNLKREQVELLRDAGVLAVQPGVESLSTHVLQLMRKGVSAIQNIALLKWCNQYGIKMAWNLLYGFPGETEYDYVETAKIMEAIYHLQPPGGASVIRLDRFSPNFDHSDQFGLVKVRPFSLYEFIYPLPMTAIQNIAYFFEYEYHDGRRPKTYITDVLEKMEVWKSNSDGNLVKEYGEDPELTVVDTRPTHPVCHYPFNGLQREIYELCDSIRSFSTIVSFVKERSGISEGTESGVRTFLEQMVALQLMMREGTSYLSLAVEKKHAA